MLIIKCNSSGNRGEMTFLDIPWMTQLSYVTKFSPAYNQSITTVTFNGDETTFPDDSINKST
jgi:hypothetical protein